MRNKGPAQVRIIGGQWKRTPLKVVDAQGLRPTPDRVRETVFNWIGDKVLAADCLDLFAGTGALGWEAASRGAASVQMIEANAAARTQLLATKDKLQAQQVQLRGTDALQALQRLQGQGLRFDLVFLDPPFGLQWLQKVLPLLPGVLKPEAWVYVEAEQAIAAGESVPWEAPWQVLKSARAGQVHYHLLQLQPKRDSSCQP